MAEFMPLGRLVQRALRGCGRTIGTLSEEELGAYVEEVRLPGRRAAVVNWVRSVLREDPREFQARLRAVRAPALLLWGAADRTVPVELGRRLARELPGARLVELDAGHIPNQECPGAVAGEILKFLP
jgi:pimeloyl-ACP methyl ester carboxylesterase